MQLRSLTPADLPEILRVQAEAYAPALYETSEAFLNKMALFPEGSFGSFERDVLQGYLIAVPWRGDAVVLPDKLFSELPPDADTLFIHDVAVGAAARGKGAGRLLAEHAFEVARRRGIYRIALMAVSSADAFWARFGFRPVEALEYLPGVPAVRMVLDHFV